METKRTGAPLTPARHDQDLSTEIGYKADGRGNTLSAEKHRQLGRLWTHHTRAKWQSKTEFNLAYAGIEIARMTSSLDLSRAVREGAATIFREAQQTDLITGRSIEALAAGSV